MRINCASVRERGNESVISIFGISPGWLNPWYQTKTDLVDKTRNAALLVTFPDTIRQRCSSLKRHVCAALPAWLRSASLHPPRVSRVATRRASMVPCSGQQRPASRLGWSSTCLWKISTCKFGNSIVWQNMWNRHWCWESASNHSTPLQLTCNTKST
jgi:hypothetical protein